MLLLTFDVQDHQISSSTDLIAFEDPLQFLESSGFVASSEIMHAPTVASVPDLLNHGLSLPPDLSQFIDWTTLLNGGPSEPASDSLFPQSYVDYALPGIDLSMQQLPQLWTTVSTELLN